MKQLTITFIIDYLPDQVLTRFGVKRSSAREEKDSG